MQVSSGAPDLPHRFAPLVDREAKPGGRNQDNARFSFIGGDEPSDELLDLLAELLLDMVDAEEAINTFPVPAMCAQQDSPPVMEPEGSDS